MLSVRYASMTVRYHAECGVRHTHRSGHILLANGCDDPRVKHIATADCRPWGERGGFAHVAASSVIEIVVYALWLSGKSQCNVQVKASFGQYVIIATLAAGCSPACAARRASHAACGRGVASVLKRPLCGKLVSIRNEDLPILHDKCDDMMIIHQTTTHCASRYHIGLFQFSRIVSDRSSAETVLEPTPLPVVGGAAQSAAVESALMSQCNVD
ncbi:unnamed protein product [Chrysodeixis includens]|uniref:Uncharacterized protein n=1 Tax=Chrysodeixis includens TaxID=689277 RepID=A0A9N8KZA0_CHRIL|nr:unnamed protein product [Chrysodeixis includens]